MRKYRFKGTLHIGDARKGIPYIAIVRHEDGKPIREWMGEKYRDGSGYTVEFDFEVPDGTIVDARIAASWKNDWRVVLRIRDGKVEILFAGNPRKERGYRDALRGTRTPEQVLTLEEWNERYEWATIYPDA